MAIAEKIAEMSHPVAEMAKTRHQPRVRNSACRRAPGRARSVPLDVRPWKIASRGMAAFVEKRKAGQ